jgi:hypothetical protein
VTFNTGLYRELEYYVNLIKDYINRETDKPLNILILSPPGGGKTFLVKQIQKVVSDDLAKLGKKPLSGVLPAKRGIPFLECQVASYTSVDELIRFLSRIAKKSRGDNVPFVFFDEVDACIGGEFAYKYLLAPTADGVFLGGRKTIKIGKSILFFAGSSFFELDDDNLSEFRGNEIPYSEYRKIVVDQVETSVSHNIERMQKIIELTLLGKKVKFPVVQELQTENALDKAIDFIDRMNVFICLPRGDFRLTDTDPEKFLSCTPEPLESLGNLINERLEELAPGSLFSFENLIIAIVLIKKLFRKKVKFVELYAALFIASILQESASRRKAESIIKLSLTPSGSHFDLDDISLYALDTQMQRSIEKVLGNRNSNKKLYLRLK